MDQVKEQLAVALKHGFWIGSGLVLIGSLAVWYLSTSELDKKTASQTGKIKSNISAVTQYRGDLDTQPNQKSHDLMQNMIDERKGEVLQAWQKVFDAQRKILTWPEQLGESFLREFKYGVDEETGEVDKAKLKLPFEKYEQHPPEGERVAPSILRDYETYIGDQLPGYAAAAKAEWSADFKAGGRNNMAAMMGGGMDDMMMGGMMNRKEVDISGAVKEPVLKWSTASQDALLKDLFPWKGRKEYPSELDVYYSQENLWILRQLLQIVAEVNGDAKQNFEAKIREIKTITIGKSVKFTSGQLSEPGSRVSAGMMGMGGMDDMDMMGMGGMDEMDMMGMGGMGMGGMGMEDEVGADPGDDRYVNTAFEPIQASQLRSALDSNSPTDVAIAVAKRVPVMLQLQMDQRSVADLLAACGSAPLMVDVHQVREMPKGGSSSMMGGGMMDMMGGGGMDEMMGGMGGMGMGGMGGAVTRTDEEFPLDMDVEIYGLIYFYNPPNEESLGIEKVTEEVTIDQSAETIEALPDPTTPPAAQIPVVPGTPATTTDPADAAAPDAAAPEAAAPVATPPAAIASPVAGG